MKKLLQRKVFIIALLCVIVVIFFTIYYSSKSNDDTEMSAITCNYIDPISGGLSTLSFSAESNDIKTATNLWIKALQEHHVSYGLADDGESILNSLVVEDVYFENEILIVAFNEHFLYFENSGENNYTHPDYFIASLSDFLSKTTTAEFFTIKYKGKNDESIHPEGYLLDNIKITTLD